MGGPTFLAEVAGDDKPKALQRQRNNSEITSKSHPSSGRVTRIDPGGSFGTPRSPLAVARPSQSEGAVGQTTKLVANSSSLA